MRYLGITLLALMFAAVPTTLFAECGCEPACPTCPAPCLTCPAEPASIGAGPCPELADLCGCDFDQAFMRLMYQQHSDIAALATQGIQLSTNKAIRDLSGKIRYEQTKQSQKLAYWAQKQGMCTLTADYNRIQCVMDSLKQCCGADYNVPYVKTMIGLLEQNRAAAQLALSKATMPGLRDQARIVVNSTSKEIVALQNWLSRYGEVCPVCPSSTGAGPCCPPATCPTCPTTCPPATCPTCPTPCPTCP
ncbi:DUF305 domain-containing protein [bacterium]|nr:DUF305 domain-containing protein [bacterium]